METINVERPISLEKLKQIATQSYSRLIKAVVDIELKTMTLGAPLHSDEEAQLLKKGSQQKNLWGINLYPEFYQSKNFIEFDSMINLRPGQGNMTRGVDNPTLRERIKKIVFHLIKDKK